MQYKSDQTIYGRINYSRVANRILFHGEATRQLIAKDTGLSMSAVTKHTSWLKEHQFIEVERFSVKHAKKPIDKLKLKAGTITSLVVSLRPDCIIGELIGMDLRAVYYYKAVLKEVSQSTLLASFQEVVIHALGSAEDSEIEVSAVGVSVAGCVDSKDGIIFSVRGIPSWKPCQPWEILSGLRGSPRVAVWPRPACKVRGLCDELKTDHRVAFVECDGEHVSLAAMHDGEISYGSHGTTSHLLHTTISDREEICYCGRQGCFCHHLNTGEITPELMMSGLTNVIEALPEDYFVVEWSASNMPMKSFESDDSAVQFKLIDDGEKYHMAGLRALTAQSALTFRIAKENGD